MHKLEMATRELQSTVIDLVNLYNQRKDKEYEGEILFAEQEAINYAIRLINKIKNLQTDKLSVKSHRSGYSRNSRVFSATSSSSSVCLEHSQKQQQSVIRQNTNI